MGPSVLPRARELDSLLSQQLLRATTFGYWFITVRRKLVLEQTQDEQEIIDRVAALDIGKAELCVVSAGPTATGAKGGEGGARHPR